MAGKKNTGAIVGVTLAVLVLSCCCVTGIVGSLGYDSFQGYQMQSRLSEPRFELATIARAQEAFCQEHGTFVPSAGPQPATHGPQTRTAGEFASDPGFSQLGYDAYMPVYFSYQVAATGIASVEIRAVGDADGDGEDSTHTIVCVQSGCECTESPISTGDLDETLAAF